MKEEKIFSLCQETESDNVDIEALKKQRQKNDYICETIHKLIN